MFSDRKEGSVFFLIYMAGASFSKKTKARAFGSCLIRRGNTIVICSMGTYFIYIHNRLKNVTFVFNSKKR
jgi:hypothetical protein